MGSPVNYAKFIYNDLYECEKSMQAVSSGSGYKQGVVRLLYAYTILPCTNQTQRT
jgi:hypothetical protein